MSNPLSEIKEIPSQTNYWFIRSDSGDKFDTYLETKTIGIGPNIVSPNDLKTLSEDSIRAKIEVHVVKEARLKDEILSDKRKKTAISRVYNRILRFVDLKKGDVVIMPSSQSHSIAFGIINDDKLLDDITLQAKVGYNKLRQVKWMKVKTLSELDHIFYKIVKPQQAFSSVKKYQRYIDRVMFKVYQKNGFCHLTIDVKKEGDVQTIGVLNLINQLQFFVTDINDYFGYDEEVDSNFIRINVQSPGQIEQFLKVGQSIAGLSIVLGILSCGPNETLDLTGDVSNKYNIYVNEKSDRVEALKDTLIKMEVNLLELKESLEN